MHRRLNRIVALVLSAVLALAGVSNAHARVRTAAEAGTLTQVTICLGTSVMTVLVGADGKPVTVFQPCPDALPPADTPPAPVVDALFVARVVLTRSGPEARRFAIRPRREPVAPRAPPLLDMA